MQSIYCLVILSFLVFVLVSGREYCQQYAIEGKSYRVQNWNDAKAECEKMGMSLAKIDDMFEDTFLRKYLEQENPGYSADGWFIGGIYRRGQWQWTDGSRMDYQNFPPTGGLIFGADDVTNYAFIMKNGYQWGYVSPFGTQKMGYICESTRC